MIDEIMLTLNSIRQQILIQNDKTLGNARKSKGALKNNNDPSEKKFTPSKLCMQKLFTNEIPVH